MIPKTVAKQIQKTIKQADKIIIAKHQHPDWDAEGSAIGLAHLIQQNYPEKEVFVVGSRLSDNQDFLPQQDLSGTFIKNSLLIVVDTANSDRIDFPWWKTAAKIMKIDHHLNVEDYGHLNIVDDAAIACSQMIIHLASMLKWQWNSEGATNLYRGLVTDSGRFLHNKTNRETYLAAAIVAEAGCEIQKVNEELYVDRLQNRQLMNYAFNKMVVTTAGVAYITLQPQVYEKWNLTYNQLKNALGVMAGIEEIKIWVLIIEWNGENKVSLRSRRYDVNAVAKNYGGGGHKLAAGAKLTKFEDHKQLIKDLNNLVRKTDKETKNGAN